MLINCVAYQNGKKLAYIGVQQVSDYLERADFVWVALRDASDGELETMQEDFRLHELAVEGRVRPRHGQRRSPWRRNLVDEIAARGAT
ncbi:hypothetical protein [Methylibium sp.]|uniref:hypothetical protein n=1 Tax=Methylibium sp. TaxID=2067992 RepID=UPI00345BB105